MNSNDEHVESDERKLEISWFEENIDLCLDEEEEEEEETIDDNDVESEVEQAEDEDSNQPPNEE